MFKTIDVDFAKIASREDFHDLFSQVFGFPDFYGRNMHAWIDCMRSLRSPKDGLSKFALGEEEVLLLRMHGFSKFSQLENDFALNILYCIGVVNNFSVDSGTPPLISYSVD
ncbi:barstar family protein [Loktanella agnita]|uniref:barstar family protein n=1 Tax=Loktanella agnita TaxID=287097 RepID=UPI003986AAC9